VNVGTKGPDLNLLPILVALYDELSVSGAGRRLGMSQPSVSKVLRRLRETFGDQLFVRGPSGFVSTPRAHVIVRAVRPHLEKLQDDLLREEDFQPRTSMRPITLAVSDIAEMTFLPAVLAHLRRNAPKCPVTTVLQGDDDLAIGLEGGEIDIAAGYHPALSRRNFRKRLLRQHAFACLMRAGHALSGPRLTASQYTSAQHLGVRRAGSSQDVLNRFLERRKMQLDVPVYTSQVLSAPFLVMESDLVATLPYAVVTRFTSLTSKLEAALPPFDLTYDLTLHWHRRFDNDPRSIWIREQMAAVFKDHRWIKRPSGPAPFVEA
jgi:DNA-binding transcriptional LysR family regulator